MKMTATAKNIIVGSWYYVSLFFCCVTLYSISLLFSNTIYFDRAGFPLHYVLIYIVEHHGMKMAKVLELAHSKYFNIFYFLHNF